MIGEIKMNWVEIVLIVVASLLLLATLGFFVAVIYSLVSKNEPTTEEADEIPDRAWRHGGKD